MADINLVIDHTLAEARGDHGDAVYLRVDPTKIGVMGHSLGGSAALGIGRVRPDVTAVMALESPFLDDIEGVEADHFVFNPAPYPVPVLNVYTSSFNHLGEWSQYAENDRLLFGSNPTAFTVHIQGAGHLDLTDLALTSPVLTRLLDGQRSTADSRHTLTVINRISLNFFDTYLKREGKFTSDGTY
jgi:predicted dienelactone hydrolase